MPGSNTTVADRHPHRNAGPLDPHRPAERLPGLSAVNHSTSPSPEVDNDLRSVTPMTIERLPLQANGHLISRKAEVDVLRFDGREPYVSGAAYRCAVCDRRPVFRVTDSAVHVQEPCPYPDGITTKITIDVPSGKLLVTDDLRPAFNWDDNAIADYNSTLGQAQAVEAMAAVGCAYGPVGNSCPGLYRTCPDSYIIASPCYDDDDKPSLPESACLANICTDLWAYSIVDLEHWKAKGGDPAKLGWIDVVDVHPRDVPVHPPLRGTRLRPRRSRDRDLRSR
ncbi:hypothetical protein [Streptomyces sp. NPDC006510]|uniref:hypothetical protein n=1 Tax=Streptomyces sp. NPDC006510 TaxID=3155600 RepID=UPI0033AC8BA4